MVGAEGGEAGVRAAKGEGVQPDGAPEIIRCIHCIIWESRPVLFYMLMFSIFISVQDLGISLCYFTDRPNRPYT